MSYKSILVLASGFETDLAIDAGAWLAAEHEAVTRVLPVYPDLAAELAATGVAFGGVAPPAAFDAAEEFSRTRQQQIEQSCQSAVQAADIATGEGSGGPRLILAPYARPIWRAIERASALADLVLVCGRSLTSEPVRGRELVEEILMRQRLPLLIVRGPPESLASAAAIAWNGSSEAGRAVRAALPLFGGATGLDVMIHSKDGGQVAAVNGLSEYLQLHDVGAPNHVILGGDDPAEAIVSECRKRGVGVLVAGAYGHSRVREFVLGGVTRSLLQVEDGPSLLLAH
jgi:nucleotide-binding universal stress UspA family protein